MASQKRFQRNLDGCKVLKEDVKYNIFMIFVKNERSVGRILVKSRERKSTQKAYNLLQFRQGWVGKRCEKHTLLGDSGEPESSQKGCDLHCFREEKGFPLPAAGGRSRQPKRLSMG